MAHPVPVQERLWGKVAQEGDGGLSCDRDAPPSLFVWPAQVAALDLARAN